VLGVVTPLLAAVAMAASSLLVVGNSARSLGPDPDEHGPPARDDGNAGERGSRSRTTDRRPDADDTGSRPTVPDGGPTGSGVPGDDGTGGSDGGGRP